MLNMNVVIILPFNDNFVYPIIISVDTIDGKNLSRPYVINDYRDLV